MGKRRHRSRSLEIEDKENNLRKRIERLEKQLLRQKDDRDRNKRRAAADTKQGGHRLVCPEVDLEVALTEDMRTIRRMIIITTNMIIEKKTAVITNGNTVCRL